MAKAYKKAEEETNAKVVLRKGSANVRTSVRAKAEVKKKRSIIGEYYYEEFFTKFWKEYDICTTS